MHRLCYKTAWTVRSWGIITGRGVAANRGSGRCWWACGTRKKSGFRVSPRSVLGCPMFNGVKCGTFWNKTNARASPMRWSQTWSRTCGANASWRQWWRWWLMASHCRLCTPQDSGLKAHPSRCDFPEQSSLGQTSSHFKLQRHKSCNICMICNSKIVIVKVIVIVLQSLKN